MTRWRIGMAALLLLVIGMPLAAPFLDLLEQAQGWRVWTESSRLLALADNTVRLVAGTMVLALPPGIVAAVLLYRTDLPLRRPLRFLVLLTLFIPLPLFASAWQAALGTGGWLPLGLWSTVAADDPGIAATGIPWKPWAHGLGSASWVHAVAALPWVIVLVGQGLCWVERELEEDALMAAGPWRVLWAVSLRRAWASVLAAAIWVALLAATEITVTDMMQVRTFAEEVYTQFIVGDKAAVAGAVAAAVPMVVLFWFLVLAGTRRWERNLPPLEALSSAPLLFPLGRARWLAFASVLLVGGVLLGIPVASLIWKAGLGGNPQAWSPQLVVSHVRRAFAMNGELVATSLGLAAAAGVLTAGLGLVSCWLAAGARWFHVSMLSLLAIGWALPGPLLGIGLKDCINETLEVTKSDTLAAALYYGPSPLPVLWAYLVRFFPFAVALLWPVVRLIPSELRDAVRLDGAGPSREFIFLILPLTWPACLRAGLAVGVLSLGELSAGKLVETPTWETFSHAVFTQMHYGVTNDLAALCLALLLVVGLGGALVAILALGAERRATSRSRFRTN